MSAAALPARLPAGVCDRAGVTITEGAAAVRLPSRGRGVVASVLTTRGDYLLNVARRNDGSLKIQRGPAAQDQEQNAAVISGCTSSAFVKLGTKVKGSYAWKYNGRGAPANVAGSALVNIKTATNNITNGVDDCGIAGKPRVGNSYTGSTAATPGVQSTATCPSASTADLVNVTGWKSLTKAGVLATTCTHFYVADNTVADSDVAINTRVRWVTATSGCSNAYDLQGVMTHERGHTYGLGHPAQTAANNGLTMDATVPTCDYYARTLGRGDLLGLFSIYGKA